MKLTKSKLRQIIKEEVESLTRGQLSYEQQLILQLLEAEPGLTTADLEVSLRPGVAPVLDDLKGKGLVDGDHEGGWKIADPRAAMPSKEVHFTLGSVEPYPNNPGFYTVQIVIKDPKGAYKDEEHLRSDLGKKSLIPRLRDVFKTVDYLV